MRVPSVEVVELHRLGRDDVGGQAEAILGRAPDSALVDELVQRAGGNAFITEELLASIQPDGRIPRNTGVTQMLLARVAMLPDEARPVVDAMSVSSARLDTAMLATILGTPERDVEASIRIALDGQVLLPTEDGSGCMFRHALLQEAVYDGLLPGERQRYHLGFARALEAASQSGPTPSAALLAEVVHHAVAANDLSMALRVSVAAGIAASSAGTPGP